MFPAEESTLADSSGIPASEQLATDGAREAVDVEDQILGAHHQLGRVDAGPAAGTSPRREVPGRRGQKVH